MAKALSQTVIRRGAKVIVLAAQWSGTGGPLIFRFRLCLVFRANYTEEGCKVSSQGRASGARVGGTLRLQGRFYVLISNPKRQNQEHVKDGHQSKSCIAQMRNQYRLHG